MILDLSLSYWKELTLYIVNDIITNNVNTTTLGLYLKIITSVKEDVIIVVCLSVCLSVCLLATSRKNFRTDWHEIFREEWQWANEQTIKSWWRSGSRIHIRIRIWIRIATLVRCALAKVCTVPVMMCVLNKAKFGME